MPKHPAHYRFFRPILWDNGEEWAEYRYSTGATANIVKYRDEKTDTSVQLEEWLRS